MDLLDSIEDSSKGKYKGLGVDTNVRNDLSDNDSDKDQTQGLLGMTFDMSKVTNAFSKAHTDISILDRVRRRLYGGDQQAEQEFGEVDTQVVSDLPFKDSILSTSNPVNEEPTQVVQKLPQLEIDEDDFLPTQPQEPEQSTNETHIIVDSTRERFDLDITQKIKDKTQTILESGFRLPPSLNTNPLVELSNEEREKRIEEIAARKRQERLEREKQQEELEADISRETLTDEENDLLDLSKDTVVSSGRQTDHTSKELKEAEEFINIQKRERAIQPEFNKKVIFTKEKLLLAFEDDSSDNEPTSELGLNNMKSSPVTSPVKYGANKPATPFSDSEAEEEINVLDLIKTNPVRRNSILPKTQGKNPIEAYAHNLKRQISSSPRNESEDKEVLIQLDSDLELEYKSPSSNVGSLHKIPELSKDEVLAIRQKFSKKKLDNNCNVMSKLPKNVRNIMSSNNRRGSSSFLTNLRKANVHQLQTYKLSNPDQEILEEMEKEEEIMGSLLEREFERTRNIRKREKLKERAAAALLGKNDNLNELEFDNEFDNESEVEEVPDSEIEESGHESYDSSGEQEMLEESNVIDTNREDNIKKPKKRSKRMILSESEDEVTNELPVTEDAPKGIFDDLSSSKRHDDSYMFGVSEPENKDSLANDGHITTVSSQNNKTENQVAFDDLYRDNVNLHNKQFQSMNFVGNDDDENLFQNLKSRNIETMNQTQNSFQEAYISDNARELPSFVDITQSAILPTPTQVDGEPTPTLKDNTIDDVNEEPVNPSNVDKGRISIRKNNIGIQSDEEEEEEEELEDPEVIKQRIADYEGKIRQKELKARKRRKELERKGIKNIIEGEAEESEDEWKGLGGVDDDLSDDQANSEDERMIDNNFNIDLKNDEIRKKFMAEYQIKDQKELEKLLDDIKNHRLTKRARANGLDIELSDEEDSLLMKYRHQKLKEQNERLAANKRLNALSKDDKSKAFFASIQDSALFIKIDDEADAGTDVDEVEKKTTTEVNSEVEDEIQTDNDDKNSDIGRNETKKTIRIEESFVQKKLSFLNNIDNGDEYEEIQKLSRFQHGIGVDEDDVEDIQSLKTRSMRNLNCLSQNKPEMDSSKKRKADEVDVDFDDDDEEEIIQHFKKPSIIKSFKSFNEQQGVQIKDGQGHFTGVTISKQYKVASGSKASISYLSKMKSQKNAIKSLKAKKIERSLANVKQHNNKLFNSPSFDK